MVGGKLNGRKVPALPNTETFLFTALLDFSDFQTRSKINPHKTKRILPAPSKERTEGSEAESATKALAVLLRALLETQGGNSTDTRFLSVLPSPSAAGASKQD